MTQMSLFETDESKDVEDAEGVQVLAYCNVCGRWAPRNDMDLIDQETAKKEYFKYHGKKPTFGEKLPGHFMCHCPEGMAWNCRDHGAPSTNGCEGWEFAADRTEVNHLTEETHGRYCVNCCYSRTVRDIVANPTGSARHCVKGLNGNPDNRRMIDQQNREGYGPHNERRNLLGELMPPEPGQCLSWLDECGEEHKCCYLFQIDGVKLIDLDPDREGEKYGVYGWSYNGAFSTFVSIAFGEFLIELSGGSLGSEYSKIGGIAELRKYVMPIRRKLGFVTDPLRYKGGEPEDEGEE